MKHLRDQGFIVTKVEQRLVIPKAPFPLLRDAFGFGDLLAADPNGRTIALIQSTDLTSVTRRVTKIISPPVMMKAARWIRAGGRIFVHGWGKRGPRDRKRWKLDEREIVERPKGFLTEVRLS
jgi:hypothetical protein